MLILFLDMREAVYQHIVPHHTTINVLYYCEALRTLKRHVNRKRPDLKVIRLLHHDSTMPHTTSIIREFLEKGKIDVLAYPMCSPNLAPFEFWVFGALKQELPNRHFESEVELVTAVNCFFQYFPPEEFHKRMTAKQKERMLACTVNGSGYFEKDIVDRDDDEEGE